MIKKNVLILISILVISYQHYARENNTRLVIQKGHTEDITSMAISYDGKYLVSGSLDNTFILWEVNSGKQIKKFGEKGDYLGVPGIVTFHSSKYQIAFTTGKNKIIYSSIKPSSDKKLKFSLPDDERITGLKICGDKKKVIASSDKGKIYLFSVKNPEKDPLIFDKHKATIHSLSLIPNQNFLASGDDNGTIYLWDLNRMKKKEKINSNQGGITGLHFQKNKHLISAGKTGSLKAWSIPKGKEVSKFRKHQDVIKTFDLGYMQDTIISYSENGNMYFQNLTTNQFLFSLEQKEKNINYVLSHPVKPILFFGKKNGSITLFNYKKRKLIKEFGGQAKPVKALALSNNNFQFLSGWNNGIIQVWNLKNLKNSQILHPHEKAIYDLGFGNDNQIFSSGKDRVIKQFAIKKNKYIHTYKSNSRANFPMVMGKKDKVFTAMGQKVGILDTKNQIVRQKIGKHEGRVTSIAYFPDQHLLASGATDENIIIYNVKNGNKIKTLKGHSGTVYSLAFSKDGKYLASGSYDKQIKLWHVKSGDEVKTFKGHEFSIWDLKFINDGKHIISASGDGNIFMWDVISGKIQKKFTGHRNSVEKINYSKKKDFLVSCSLDGTIRFWNIESTKELAKLIPLSGNDYAVVTPDGLFDASQGGMKKLHFTKGLEIISLEQLKNKYYEPGLLSKVLGFSNEPIRKTQSVNERSLYPEIELIHPSKNKGELGIKLKNRGGGMGKVKIFINKKEVNTDIRGNKFNSSRKKANLDYDLENHPYLKDGSVNKISVEVYDKDGYISSGRENLFLYKEGKKTEVPDFYGLFCGVSDYRGSKLDLKFAAKDAADISEVMKKVAEKQFGKKNVHIHKFTTSMGKNKQPNKKNIKNAFNKIAKSSQAHDIFMIYLSGHGVSFGGQDGDFYYLTNEANRPELNDPEYRKNAAISGKELTQWIKGIPALKQVMILDACNSGKLANDLISMRGMSSSQIRSLEKLKDRTGLYVLAGSASDAVSYETSVYGQGLLTYSLLFGIKGAALRNNEFLDVMNLFQYSANKVPELASNIGGIQKPEVRVPYGGESFDIGRLTDSLKSEIKLAQPKPLFVKARLSDQQTWNDIVGLSDIVNKKLNEKSKKGKESPLVFVNTDNYQDAWKIKGRYKYHEKSGKIDLKVRLFNNKNRVGEFEVSGNEKETLAKRIIEKSMNLLNKEEKNDR